MGLALKATVSRTPRLTEQELSLFPNLSRLFASLGTCLIVTFLTVGCQDSGTDPLYSLLGEEQVAEILSELESALGTSDSEQLAVALADLAAEGLRRTEGSDAYTEQELSRIRRLTGGAREALEEGDYPRAIRRAYYACRLLGVGPG
jgi:hypothetical protein